MSTEYELRILNIDVVKIQKKLQELGVKKVARKNMRRFVYDLPSSGKNAWLRLRDDGKKTTLTYKNIHAQTVDGTEEIEVVVSNFELTAQILEKIGLIPKSYQENKRISYDLKGVEIDLDFWPKIAPYLEIEADSKEKVEKTIEKLGFKLKDATGENTKEIYKKYGIDLDKIKHLKF